ncbi:LAQU0S10e00430g1_1 [Lachancea quebecensis]|uniref:LAQU0S10e00430g1_1 n=1 Tax=Lachancea quebecensis TaxID=1654605 RepID=A0A0P1KTQ9_9SACH|nr:LAQU0S10e00430g1_1 [Lachancea quebecensis]
MVELASKISEGNQLLFNQIASELSATLTGPTLEFIDVLIESFMYPRGNCSLAAGDQSQYECQEFGHNCILGMVYARHLLNKIKAHSLTGSPSFAWSLMELLEETRGALVHLLKQLSSQIELPMCSEMYRQILRENVFHFRHAFFNFQALDSILHQLLETLDKTGLLDEEVFQIDYKTIGAIQRFAADNAQWFEDIMLGSKALKEYLLLQDYSTDYLDQVTATKVPKGVKKAIRSPDFSLFIHGRKSRLKISHRRIF